MINKQKATRICELLLEKANAEFLRQKQMISMQCRYLLSELHPQVLVDPRVTLELKFNHISNLTGK